MLETIVFLALFSRRKVSVYSLRFKNRNHSYFFRKADIKLGEKIICVHLERSESSGLFLFPSAGVTLEKYQFFIGSCKIFWKEKGIIELSNQVR